MTKQVVLVSALVLAACGGKSSPASRTAGPEQCGAGTSWVASAGRCVAAEAAPKSPAKATFAQAGQGDPIAEFEALSKEMCACKDRDCAERVNQKFEKWIEEHEDASGTPEDQQRAENIAKDYTNCMMTAMGADDTPAAPVDPATIPARKKELAAQVVAMFEEVAAVTTKHVNNCDQMAAGIQRVADKHRPLIEEGKTVDDDENFRNWFDQTYGEKLKQIMTELFGSLMKNCGDHEGVKKSLESLTGE